MFSALVEELGCFRPRVRTQTGPMGAVGNCIKRNTCVPWWLTQVCYKIIPHYGVHENHENLLDFQIFLFENFSACNF